MRPSREELAKFRSRSWVIQHMDVDLEKLMTN